MSEDDWSEELEIRPAKKRRGPVFWILSGCGCGCLVVLLALLVGGIFVYRHVQEGMDPEKQWPQIDDILPFDERPEHIRLEVALHLFGPDQFFLEDTRQSLTVALYRYGGSAEVDMMFDAGSPANFAISDAESGSIQVQGREVRTLSFANVPDSSKIPEWMSGWVELPEIDEAGRTLRVDLSGPAGNVILDLSHHGGETVTEVQVEAFLEPFDVWHDD